MTKPDANGWYPIESAPRDGRYVDLWGFVAEFQNGYRIAECHVMGGEWRTGFGESLKGFQAVCWRPIPKPPVEFEEKGDG